MLEAPLTPEAAAALVKRINEREVAGRSRSALTDRLSPEHHQCVAQWHDRIRSYVERPRFPSPNSTDLAMEGCKLQGRS